MNKLIQITFLLFISSFGFAQNTADSVRSVIPDVIVTTSSNLFQCRILEVNDSQVKYMPLNQDTASKVKYISRSEVYAISYGNGIAMIITPDLLTKDAYDAKITSLAQKKADSIIRSVKDVVIKTNGNLFQCKIFEVNDSLVLYRFPDKDTIGQINTIPRGEVYAIAYGNNIAQVINPELMGRKASIYPAEGNCEGWETFKENLAHGSVNVGIGFVDFYSPIKHASTFDDNKTMPSVFAGYTFRIKGHWKAGVHIGIGGNELKKSAVSEYDQLQVSTSIDEQFLIVGLYGRYDILDGMFRPYVKGGLDFIGVFMTTTSEATSLSGSNASLKTVVDQSGIKPGLILRGGLEVFFGNMFGIYGDVGTGLSLVQAGVLFNLE